MIRPAIRRLDRLVTVVAFIALVTLLVFLFLIQRRNARMGLRTPSIFVPMELNE